MYGYVLSSPTTGGLEPPERSQIGWLESVSKIERKVGPPNLQPVTHGFFSYLPSCQDAKKPGRLSKIYLNFLVGGEPTKTPFEKNAFFSQIGSEIFPPIFRGEHFLKNDVSCRYRVPVIRILKVDFFVQQQNTPKKTHQNTL